jgi:hypothetical protein
MPILNPNDLAPDESRQEVIAEALTSQTPAVPGIVAVRGITPLVMAALHRANNPYVTGKKGFTAMGIQFEDGKTDVDAGSFGIAMMSKTAEVLILLSCDRPALKSFAGNPASLEDAALDFMEDTTPEVLAEATVFVSEQLMAISKTRVTQAPDEAETPEAAALKEGGKPGPKKLVPTGSRKS